MSERMDTLCLRLVDLARAQHAALAAGNLDEALALLEKRQCVIDEIRRTGDGPVRREAIRETLSIDDDICSAVRSGMKDIVSMLDGIEKLKRYCRDAASRGMNGRTHLTA
jgi:hypothetical protein